MPEKIYRGSPIRFADSSGFSGENTHDVQLLRVGTFTHPVYGDLEVKLADLESMVKNFNDRVRGIDIAIDYAHESEKEAAGWIESLYLGGLENNELWAKVRWTPTGAGTIKAKEYRYLSAEFQFSYTTNETNQVYGPTLLGAGLTNRPFVKGMEPIVELSEKLTKGTNQMDEKDKQIAALQAQIEELKKQLESGDNDNDSDMDMSDMKKKMEEMMAENAALKGKVQKYEEDKAMGEKKASFDKLLSEGKVCEAQREPYMKGDMVKFSEAYTKPGSQVSGHSGDAPAPGNKDEAIAQVKKFAEDMVSKGEAKNVGEAQYKVLLKHPELNKQIYG